ncbi:MAG: ribonuclease III [Sporolactobacillus sp.]
MPEFPKKLDDDQTFSNIQQLLEQFTFQFHDEMLLRQAFTHASYVNEHRGGSGENYERLEFLGDAVLELMVSQYLFKHYPELSEGDMTKLRASIVCETGLVQFATSLAFENKIFLGRGEETMGGRRRPGLLADVFEAFVGALYLDQGITAVGHFLEAVIYPRIDDGTFAEVTDYKSRLQETVQRMGLGGLDYRLASESGTTHQHHFVSDVWIDNKVVGHGCGHSKKDSEQNAARDALTHMTQS